ncbi:MAG: UvrD-helicase domain-containing protein, partial [Verrucomicrobiaceae bacterium]|nr:UvrD-helicase domain-containing protein [Verrucomicrobiaceae bacterium]
LKEASQRLRQLLETADTNDKAWEFWDQFFNELTSYLPGGKLTGRVEFFVKKALEQWGEIEAKNCTLTVNRQKQTLEGRVCDAFAAIIRHIVGGELRVRLERTQGVWAVLNQYEHTWSRQVRRRGRLTFQDMELILAGHEFAKGLPRPMLSQVPGMDERLRIDYRLDARYDHWLLDEFQDTNHIQWSVIENLIDEAVQDTGDDRTLFQVGDVKQAIYAWRGGDTRLFDDVYARYSSETVQRIHKRPLNVSWRSGHDVIEMVNHVFGSEIALSELQLPQDTIKRWPWQPHQVASVHDTMPGHALLLHTLPADGEKVTQEDRFALALGLLEEIQPVRRGLSCAILVQGNKTGRELVDFIRARSPSRIPVMCESEIAIATDNALTLALLSIIKVAAHPGDTFAWEHLRMTPFCDLLEGKTQGHLAREVLQMIFDDGFEAVLRHWVRALEKGGTALDAFSRRRAEDFALAARLFDEGGSRDADDFLAYASSHTVREPDTHNAVQVMTIHKSKGLTFDCVILPDVEGNKLTEVRRGIGVKRARDRHVEWVFDLPPSELVRADDQLAEFRAEQEADAAYEELCKFYVALTRAKHANYIIARPPGKASKSENFVKLLQLTLGDEKEPAQREFGGVQALVAFESNTKATNPRWFEMPRKVEQPVEAAKQEPLTVSGRQRPVRRTPSGSETSVVTAKQLFSRGGRFARSYGTLVHAFFEQIEWLDEVDDSQLSRLWAAVPCADGTARARAEDEVRRCLAAPAVRSILSRPSPEAACWREKRFEILLNGEWLSGTFDRVMIEPHRATILDFKTDKPDTEEAFRARVDGYRPQLETYREVLARMTGLPHDQIACRLLFTNRREVVAV